MPDAGVELLFEGDEASLLFLNGGVALTEKLLGMVETIGLDGELAFERGEAGMGVGQLALGAVEFALEIVNDPGALIDDGEAIGCRGGELVVAQAGGVELGLEIGDEDCAFIDGDKAFVGCRGEFVVALLEAGNLGLEAGDDLGPLFDCFETFSCRRFEDPETVHGPIDAGFKDANSLPELLDFHGAI